MKNPLRFLFDSVTCLNYPFLEFSQYRKSIKKSMDSKGKLDGFLKRLLNRHPAMPCRPSRFAELRPDVVVVVRSPFSNLHSDLSTLSINSEWPTFHVNSKLSSAKVRRRLARMKARNSLNSAQIAFRQGKFVPFYAVTKTSAARDLYQNSKASGERSCRACFHVGDDDDAL